MPSACPKPRSIMVHSGQQRSEPADSKRGADRRSAQRATGRFLCKAGVGPACDPRATGRWTPGSSWTSERPSIPFRGVTSKPWTVASPSIVLAMDLVYLYGPPAVGKLTVAKSSPLAPAIACFTTTLAIDCVRAVFEFGSDPFWRQVHTIREGILAEAARSGRDLISTTVYSHPDNDPQTIRRFDAVENNGGRVCLVKLTCSADVLEARVVDSSGRRRERSIRSRVCAGPWPNTILHADSLARESATRYRRPRSSRDGRARHCGVPPTCARLTQPMSDRVPLRCPRTGRQQPSTAHTFQVQPTVRDGRNRAGDLRTRTHS